MLVIKYSAKQDVVPGLTGTEASRSDNTNNAGSAVKGDQRILEQGHHQAQKAPKAFRP